ncbi:MAG: polysaccharide deacetylase family protein [Coriobacteriales bacterium]|nr:polysaccharide deacetylase family protein [Coriobacteriales bacterium]
MARQNHDSRSEDDRYYSEDAASRNNRDFSPYSMEFSNVSRSYASGGYASKNNNKSSSSSAESKRPAQQSIPIPEALSGNANRSQAQNGKTPRRSAYGNYGNSGHAQGYRSSATNRPSRGAYAQGGQPSDKSAQSQQRSQVQERRERQQPAYEIGRGKAYTSSRVNHGSQAGNRANRAAGVTPVSSREYLEQVQTRKMTRRQMIVAGASAAIGVGALGIAGLAWWTHRAVPCTINGARREAPINSSARDLVERHRFVTPRPGNLVSIVANDSETPQILEKGAGFGYTLKVNGQEVNVDTYRLAENDVLEFFDGLDRVEETVKQDTEIPCGVQMPDRYTLLAPIGYVKQWGKNGVSRIETGTVSGRVIERGTILEPQDLIIECGHINPDNGHKYVALTFDDGPSVHYTATYLDILARYGVRATFFNLGENIVEGEEYRELCRRIVAEGHQLASHTWSHNDITLSGMDEYWRNEEIRRTFQTIEDVTGTKTQVMRPPYGEFRGWGFLQYVAHVGDIACSVYWTVDSCDWELPGADVIVENSTKNLQAENYNGAIILMHDGGGNRDQDIQALPIIIERFQALGYELVTVNEMIAADSAYDAMPWISAGYVDRPADAIIPDIEPYLDY